MLSAVSGHSLFFVERHCDHHGAAVRLGEVRRKMVRGGALRPPLRARPGGLHSQLLRQRRRHHQGGERGLQGVLRGRLQGVGRQGPPSRRERARAAGGVVLRMVLQRVQRHGAGRRLPLRLSGQQDRQLPLDPQPHPAARPRRQGVPAAPGHSPRLRHRRPHLGTAEDRVAAE